MIKKSPEAYRTIGEASNEIGVPTYVLRFWETKFKQVKLIKRPGGRRFYKPEDIKLLLKIKNFGQLLCMGNLMKLKLLKKFMKNMTFQKPVLNLVHMTG